MSGKASADPVIENCPNCDQRTLLRKSHNCGDDECHVKVIERCSTCGYSKTMDVAGTVLDLRVDGKVMLVRRTLLKMRPGDRINLLDEIGICLRCGDDTLSPTRTKKICSCAKDE